MKKTFLIVFCLFTTILVKAQQTKADTSAKNTDTAPVFAAVEKEPEFNGGFSAFSRYLQQNIVYPPDAVKKRIQGKVFVTFVVEKDGTLTNIIIARGVSSDIDAEALRVIKNSPKWTPGVQNGLIVRSQFTMPLSFKLPPPDTTAKTLNADAVRENQDGGEKVFAAVEKEPGFPGGIEAFYHFLQRNIRYPEDAKKNKHQGKVFVTFVVERDGSLTGFRVARSSGYEDIDAEGMRVLQISPNWVPGMQNNRSVRVQYTIPLSFSLDNH